MERKFTPDGNALSAVLQIVAGAKFRGVRYDPWDDGKTSTCYLRILNDQGQTIGETETKYRSWSKSTDSSRI